MGVSKCDLCGNPVKEGSYYQKGEVKTCLTCSLAVPPDQARALAHDQMRKASEHAGEEKGIPKRTGAETERLCQELEVEARKLAVAFVREAGASILPRQETTVNGKLAVMPSRSLDDSERLVKLAQMLDILADKVISR